MADEPSLTDMMVIDCEKVTNTIVDFIRTKVDEQRKDGVALGLSGGVDSATAATLSVKAMAEPSKVHALYLFDRDSDKKFGKYAQELAKELGIYFEAIDITPLMVQHGVYSRLIMRQISMSAALNKLVVRSCKALCSLLHIPNPFVFTPKKRGRLRNRFTMSLGNATAGTIAASFRVRHIQRRRILEDYASQKNLLLIGTTNRSEYFVGWFVQDGIDDLPIEILLGLYKNQVRRLARFLGVPAEIIKEPASPDMFRGILDRDLIGYSYEEIDKVAYVTEHGLNPDMLNAEGISPNRFQEILTINRLSQGKLANEHVFPSFE